MAAPKVFIDTNGFYALFVRQDAAHERAKAILRSMRETGRRACTTDYVVDETGTLLKARGLGHLNAHFFAALETSEALEMYFIGEERLSESRNLFQHRADQPYSFTTAPASWS